jgi:hypothetical protein
MQVLSKSAVRALVENVLPVCHNDTVGSAEDVFMGRCLQDYLNVTGYDTRDDEERDRFIWHDLIRRALVPNRDDRRFNAHIRQQTNWLKDNHNFTPKFGIDAIAPSLISFHKAQPAVTMKRYERLLYRKKDLLVHAMDCQNGYEILSA